MLVNITRATGADPNARNCKGHTILHMAAASDHQPDVQRQLVQLLLQYKASASIWDKQGNTTLHFAAAGSTTDVLQLLLSASSEVSTPNYAGQTPLELAAQHGRVGNCKGLLARGAREDERDLGALFAAAGAGQTRVVQLLIEDGAVLSEFAVAAAAANDHPSVVKLLLERGVVLSEFALAAAAAKNHTTVLFMLLAALPEASISAAARIAVPAAAYAGHMAALELLLPHAGYDAVKQEEFRAAATHARCYIHGA